MSDPLMSLVRHEADALRERSTCGERIRLISTGDEGMAAWAHVVDIDESRDHYHKETAEIYYILEGEGVVRLDDVEHRVKPGSIVHIPPGVIHGGHGRMRVLVVGIPSIDDGDLYFPDEQK
jgi:mannose-6-phosphate isomerase-like protein (cupin superfamily)